MVYCTLTQGVIMPLYTFTCDPEIGGCNRSFEVVMSMSKYSSKQKCPHCKKIKSVIRDYRKDTLTDCVILSDDKINLGHLAHRNSDRYSNDQKVDMTKKHNEYKQSPEGSENLKGKWMGPVGHRKPITKQRKKDIRRKS